MWPCGTISRSDCGELVGVLLADALVLAGDDDVDAVGVVADVVVDPVQLDGELLGAEADGSEHPEPAGPADGRHHVTAVREGENGELDPQLVTQLCVHEGSSPEGASCHSGSARSSAAS